MANPTTNYGFVLPTATDLVTDLPADFEVALQGVDTQMKTNADAATQKATLTTKGDIYAATGTSTPARLAVGANDTVLIADSTTATGLKWGTPISGGYTLISTTTLSGNSVTISSIPSTYKHLYFTVTNLTCSANDDFAIRFNSNTSSNYSVLDFGQTTAGTFGTGGGIALSRIVYSDFCSANALPGTGEMFISNYTDTSATGKTIVGNYMGRNTAGSSLQRFAQGYYSQTSAISSITVLGFGGATFTTGTIRLWGIS
jgi:hypothetical protein